MSLAWLSFLLMPAVQSGLFVSTSYFDTQSLVRSAASMADKLGVEFALFHKERRKASEVSRMVLVGNVFSKIAILVDDMADTCGTLFNASVRLKEAGASAVAAIVTHGILSDNAMEKLAQSELDKLIVTNTIPPIVHQTCGQQKIEVIDIGYLLGEVIRRSHHGESVSLLFDEVPF